MQICVLNSGSDGNSICITSGGSSILIDAGICYTSIRDRLAAIGRNVNDLCAVLITHEHTDHCSGLPVLTKKCPNIPVYANYETSSAADRKLAHDVKGNYTPIQWCNFETGDSFDIGPFTIQSFSIQHDTVDPVGYIVSDGERKVGVITDLGIVTEIVKRHARGCDALVLETNHDYDMLVQSDRSWLLKQRISGRNGHLSNEQAAELLAFAYTDNLKAVFTAHISEECNKPELAESAMRIALRALKATDRVKIYPTFHGAPSEVLTI